MRKILALFAVLLSTATFAQAPTFEKVENEATSASIVSWANYRTNFGMEKVFVRFPFQPTVTQSGSLLNAYCYKSDVLYSFCGFYPPIGNINPHIFFDRALHDASEYPNVLVDYSKYRTNSGYWVLDHTIIDESRNLVVKSRTVVTPFNAYTLQTIFPSGRYNYYGYFLDSLSIQCECDQ